MEKNLNNHKEKEKSNSYKFTSSLLTRPFSSSDQRQNVNNNEIIEEIPDPDLIEKNNMTYYNNNNNNPDFNYSVSNIQKNEESILSNASINFTKKDLMNQFNSQNNNLNISSSTITSRKRKPFEKLSFHSDSQTNISDKLLNNNLQNDQTEDTKSLTNMNNIIDDKPISISENNPNDLSNITQSNMSRTQLSFDEKSMILSCYKLLSKETLEKAKKFNSNYKNSTPFWIKFFEDIENDTLSANSSYFKYDNKNEYIKSLIEMVQRDADIYDEINKSKKKKEETQNSIKKLLEESKKVQEDIKNKSTTSNKNNNNSQTQEEKSQIELDNKLNQVLNIYNKLEEKNKKLYNNEKDYDTFKNLLITGGKFTNDEPSKKNIPEQIKKLENLEEIEEENKNEKEKEKKENKENNEITNEKTKTTEYKTIDALYFGENYTFEDLNYDKIDFFVYEKDSIKRLLELDRQLNKIDPVRYNTSINTELKKIQDDFNKGKKERYEKTTKAFKEDFYKFLKESKDKKKSIFDIPVKDESKIKYKDYLKEFQDQKKYKKDLENRLNQLDYKIRDIYKKDISDSQMKELQKQIENYRKTDEYKKKFEETKVPGLAELKSLTNDIKEFDKKNQEISESLKELRKQLEIEKQNQINKEDEEKFKKEIIEPFIEHKKEIENIDKDNKIMNEKINKLEEANKKEENMLIEIQKQLDEINNNKDKYEKMFEEADKIMEMREEENKKNNNEENKNDIFEDADEIIKKYGINNLIEEQKKNEEVINYYENNLKIAENTLNNLKKINEENDELLNKEFMSPEEFCKIPDEVKAYFEEKKREEEEKKKKLEEKKNENNEKNDTENNLNNQENKIEDLKVNDNDINIKDNEDNKNENNKIKNEKNNENDNKENNEENKIEDNKTEDEKFQENINNISKDSLEGN